eukprot:2681421-Rhodomonas_salina.1
MSSSLDSMAVVAATRRGVCCEVELELSSTCVVCQGMSVHMFRARVECSHVLSSAEQHRAAAALSAWYPVSVPGIVHDAALRRSSASCMMQRCGVLRGYFSLGHRV